ncbi:hypothetical protein RGQ29_026924 [Quercus rubra]|uniref:AAA+ ATPase domain-containing protein n=1 Tax=Quercus rubra TaxID=3512 RepID=A0AAN7IKM5_QUERU|nr:hypothetical protein RGQ29_026924 [Quercus rubra]
MDILTGCTGSIAAEVVKSTAKPVIRHVGYLFRFKKIVDDLIKAKTDLQSEQQKVQETIERAAMNNEIAEKDVESWLTNVNQLMVEVQALEIKVQVNLRFCNGCCPDWIRQYKLCKEAMQKTNVVKELQDKGKFSKLTHRAPIPGIEIFSSSDFEVFESTKLAFQQILEALRDDNSKRIGLHGIGGVGKTTLVKEVHKKTKELNIFDEIVMTVVSLTPNVRRIQGEIAGCLNLKLDGESDMARAGQICLRIKNVEKILIILDDVWKDVELEAIGIPTCDDHRGCKMLLTTRSVHVCNLMRCERKIPLNFLVEEESLALMKKTAIVDDDKVPNDVVLEVVKECKGLPIAIITVGKALTRKSLNDWNAAKDQLRESRLVDIEGVDEDKNAYACLKWSFDQLKRKTKLCFLLCSLFPEDYDIPIEELTRYVMGLEEEVQLLEDTRRQVRAAVNSLKDSSLLLEGFEEDFVKMHDMVRDIGLWITSKGENEFELRACTRLERDTNFERATAISLIKFNTKQLPDKLVCPRLNILLLGGIQSSENISNALFEGMNCLKVLALHDIILSSQSLELLTNLRTLYLEDCDFNDNLSSLGKLKRLEVLSFYSCGINALPSELGEMVSLKMLDLTFCDQLQQIPPNVIRRLSQLEELIIRESFKDWGVEGTTSEISSANLSELNSLPRLVILSLKLNSNHLPKGFVFPDLHRYYIAINCEDDGTLPCTNSRTLEIRDLNASSMNALKSLFHTVEYILIESCEMECIVDTVTSGNLVELYLKEMSCLRTICEGPNQYEIFSNLTVLHAHGCPRLISLFSPSLAQSLKKLKRLSLVRCDEMKQIISEEGMILESHGQPICLSKLETLKVKECGKLEYIFPISVARDLQQLSLRYLPQLKKVFGQNREGEVGDCEIESHHQPTGFPKLQTIWVGNCENLEYIFPISIARDLPQLESLELRDLPQLKQVFGHEKGGDDGDGNNIFLSKLRKLRLQNLPELVSLGGGNGSSVWPSLERLDMVNCPKVKWSFFANVEANVQKKMLLIDLLELSCIWKGATKLINLNNLEDLKVIRCKKLTHLFTPALTQSLQKLKFLEIERCDELEHLIVENAGEQVLSESHPQPLCFLKPNVVKVKVKSCNKLKYLFHVDHWNPVSIFLTLEELKLKNCGGLQEVFNFEGFLTREGEQQDEFFPRLRKMFLVELHELTYIWKGPIQLINFNNLEDLKVIGCKKLTHLFTPALTQSLQKLKFLEIERCDELEHLIVENAEEQVLSESHPQPLCFLKPNVVKVKVKSCNKLKCLFHVDHWNPVSIFLTLEELELKNCGGLQEVFNFEGFLTREGEQQDEFFPRLREMFLFELHELTYIWKGPIQLINFNNLKDLAVIGCKKLTHLFTPTLAQSLQKLKFLEIERCDELEHIIVENVEEQVSSENHLQPLCFPELISVSVRYCNKLKYLFTSALAQSLQNLQFLKIQRCDELEHIIVENVEEQVSSENHLQPLCFPKLKRVGVTYCNKLKYLFPMTIADSLLELKILIVKENSQLMEVFTHEGDAGVQKDVMLPQLEFMGLKGLPSLVNFCPNNYQNLAFQQIMEALHDDNSKRIGLHGIGGVGKTTLVKEVHKKTKELNIFDEIVMTVLSLTPNVRRIQGEIAGCLNLKLDGESDMARASQICLRIKNVEKILIILDDVWKDVDLEAIGIPSCDDHRGWKMLLTTRSAHVCTLMRCQRKIPLNFLVEEESLALMKKTAIVDDCPVLNDVVLEVVKECKGLPIAIITVGKALTGKSLNDWNVAMHQLRKSRLVDIEGVDEDKNAYACLKWSFDQLKRKTKLCFLLCSLFPEDYNIPIEELTRYMMGLEEDEDFHLLEDARCQVHAAVNSLKDSSLLLEGFNKDFVKMHDMVRDIGLWITSKGKNEFELRACTRLERNTNFERATAISLIDFNTKQLPGKLVCPRLNILLLGGIQSSENISNALFEGMNCLKVLALHDIILSSQSLELLTNLRTLYLKNCNFNDNLSSLGKLKRLEALSFYRCGINALPSELGEMVSLKMLDLAFCNQLQQIPPNVIQRLSQLEELIISSNFKNWDVEGTTSEISNPNLSELNSLPRLVILSLQLNSNHLPKGFVFPDLHRYFIVIGEPFLTHVTPWETLGEPLGTTGIPWRTLVIKDLNASSMNALKSLFHTVEYIQIESCEMECIVDTIGGNHTVTFGNLVELHLREMRCLRTICEGPNQYEIFSNLTDLVARRCPRLISLFSPSLAQSLKKLKRLSLDRCHEMKQIISEEGMILESHDQQICLPNLEILEVTECFSLEYIFPISVARGLQQLERLKLRDLPRLKKVFGQNREGEVGDCEIESHHQPTGFPKLKTIKVVNCENLECLSIARDLPQLEKLSLYDLPQLKQVFGHEKEGDDGDGNNSVLSKLRNLRLRNLPELVSFGGGNSSLVWPSLESLAVVYCPKVKLSFFANVEANVPALQKILPVDDWNAISFDLMQGLSNLEELKIKNYGGIHEVIKLEGLLTIKGERDLSLPRLKNMSLIGLHELRCIWKGATKLINLNNLEDLAVIGCKKLTHLFTPALAQSLQKLESLKIERCDELEHIIVENVEEQVSLDSHLQPLCFPKLKRVYVRYCKKLKYLFPMTIADSLLELKILIVKENSQLMEVFTHEGDAGVQKDVTLPQLEFMGLKGLPSLVNFCPNNYQFILPKWRELRVESCKNMRTTFTRTPDISVLINGEVIQYSCLFF